MAENVEHLELSPPSVPHFDVSELTRSEYIAALVHFYRGELHRSTIWRVRLDTTTNWAILSVMGLVTFTFGDLDHSHAPLIVGMLLVLTFMGIEARRYRIFNVWCARVRNLEVNFLTPILQYDMKAVKQGWGRLVAEDLLHPRFNMTWQQALRARLLRNYLPLFLLLLVCWLVKLQPGNQADLPAFPQWIARMRMGFIPGWGVCGFVVLLYTYLAGLMFTGGKIDGEEKYFGVSDNLLHKFSISEVDAAD
ncbi:MAG: DUF2270 domain-containing protein [Bythopirellula sp.]|nr:DUF2270 domain-containing protein [Bythopirellula sp.]